METDSQASNTDRLSVREDIPSAGSTSWSVEEEEGSAGCVSGTTPTVEEGTSTELMSYWIDDGLTGAPTSADSAWFTHHVVSLGYPYVRPKPEMNGQGSIW